MTQEEILKAFEGRWRIKKDSLPLDSLKYEGIAEKVKTLCLDFFATGILLGEPQKNGIEIFNVDKMHEATEQLDGELMTPFEYWWDLYDKKRGKEKCIKKWKQMTNDECIACISATSAYVASTPDKQFRKDPLTYLNQKAWNDEIIFRNGTDKQQQQRDRLAEVANRIAEYTQDAK